MIQHKIKAKSLATDFQSEQFSLSQKTFSGKSLNAQSVQIVWNGLAGTFDGILEIWASAGDIGAVKLASYTPLGADNLQNAIIYFLTQPYAELFIKYTAAGNTAGRLDMYLNYSNAHYSGI
jgi:hypothetical protein